MVSQKPWRVFSQVCKYETHNPQKSHHGVTNEVTKVAFLKAACLCWSVQEHHSLPHHLGWVISQTFLPLLHITEHHWICGRVQTESFLFQSCRHLLLLFIVLYSINRYICSFVWDLFRSYNLNSANIWHISCPKKVITDRKFTFQNKGGKGNSSHSKTQFALPKKIKI